MEEAYSNCVFPVNDDIAKSDLGILKKSYHFSLEKVKEIYERAYRSEQVEKVLMHVDYNDNRFKNCNGKRFKNYDNYLANKSSVSQPTKDFLLRTKREFKEFFSVWVFLHKHKRSTGQQGRGEAISLSHPLYHFRPLHRHLDISQGIAAGSSPLYIDSSRTMHHEQNH